jgi:hypothetical protein
MPSGLLSVFESIVSVAVCDCPQPVMPSEAATSAIPSLLTGFMAVAFVRSAEPANVLSARAFSVPLRDIVAQAPAHYPLATLRDARHAYRILLNSMVANELQDAGPDTGFRRVSRDDRQGRRCAAVGARHSP